ncbi:YfjI family protein [Pseudochelatococcus lubricantis]|uniref:YfjI family protein n=1 Tax=Pseudochelatococcus lubricantis TaxID=1538102 RepID=UPI0035EA90CE
MVTIDLEKAKASYTHRKRELPSTALPLLPEVPDPAPFPMEALGPLQAAAEAIARKVQVPHAMAANSVLAAAALAAQAHADVDIPDERPKPLSLFFITVAESGDRKSGADHEALAGINDFEADLRTEHKNEKMGADARREAWAAARRKIIGDKKKDAAAMTAELMALGPEPDEPLDPFVVASDVSIDGLIKNMPRYHASLGLFGDEGAVFFGGYSMSKDHAGRSGGLLSKAWDGAALKRIRADKDERTTIASGRRLSCHLMAQPAATLAFINNPTLRDQGLTARFLIAYPRSLAGTRMRQEPLQDDLAAIGSLRIRLRRMMEAGWPLAEGARNQLAPPALRMSDQAKSAWETFSNEIERELDDGGGLRPIKPLVCKAAEMAARLAGVLTVYDAFVSQAGDLGSIEISAAMMEKAITILHWYIDEALRLLGESVADENIKKAAELSQWALKRGAFNIRDVMRSGPASCRGSKELADKLSKILIDHGHIEECPDRKGFYRKASATAD